MKWMCNLDVTESCNSKSFDLLLPIFNAKIAQSLQSSRRFKVRIILLRWTTTVEFYSLTDFNWPCCLIELTPLTKFYNTSYWIPLHESNKFDNETSKFSRIFANFTILYSIWESEKFVDINLFKKKKRNRDTFSKYTFHFVNRINFYSKLGSVFSNLRSHRSSFIKFFLIKPNSS